MAPTLVCQPARSNTRLSWSDIDDAALCTTSLAARVLGDGLGITISRSAFPYSSSGCQSLDNRGTHPDMPRGDGIPCRHRQFGRCYGRHYCGLK